MAMASDRPSFPPNKPDNVRVNSVDSSVSAGCAGLGGVRAALGETGAAIGRSSTRGASLLGGVAVRGRAGGVGRLSGGVAGRSFSRVTREGTNAGASVARSRRGGVGSATGVATGVRVGRRTGCAPLVSVACFRLRNRSISSRNLSISSPDCRGCAPGRGGGAAAWTFFIIWETAPMIAEITTMSRKTRIPFPIDRPQPRDSEPITDDVGN